MMQRISTTLALAMLCVSPVFAQNGPPPAVPAERPEEPGAIPLYGSNTPGTPTSENWAIISKRDYVVRNVTYPTLTPFLPAPGKRTGTGVIVLPGGGFMSLSIDHEGTRVAKALARRGIAAFVLKYRLFQTPSDPVEAQRHVAQRMKEAFSTSAGPDSLFNQNAVTDAAEALRMVRARGKEWSVDPEKLGIIGFSAGARTSLKLVLDAPAQDRPKFFGYVYGDLASKPVPADAPPMFAAIAFDDALYPRGTLALAQDWHAAKRPVELHVYQKGNHGFGLGVPGTTTTLMIDQFTSWLSMQGFLKPKAAR
jgi:acetyl esterase/lipase